MLKLKAYTIPSQPRKIFLGTYFLIKIFLSEEIPFFLIHDKQLKMFNIIMDTKSMCEGIDLSYLEIYLLTRISVQRAVKAAIFLPGDILPLSR